MRIRPSDTVQELIDELGLRTILNAGDGNCFPLAVQDGTEGRVSAGDLRTRMRQYVDQNPNAACVRVLPQADRVGFDNDRAWITDAQARLAAVVCTLDLFIFDIPNQCARYVCHAVGEVRFPTRRVSVNMLRTR